MLDTGVGGLEVGLEVSLRSSGVGGRTCGGRIWEGMLYLVPSDDATVADGIVAPGPGGLMAMGSVPGGITGAPGA